MEKFLSYSRENQSNIIPQDEFEEIVHEVFNIISENLCKSLGPLGSSATIIEGMMIDATKDGYSIMDKYRFHNRYKKMIYNLIKAPCTRMNNTVGDGTTTAIALTNAFYNRYMMRKGAIETLYRLPRQLTNALDDVIEDLKRRIQDKATPIDPDNFNDVYNIAYVSSNGNKQISTDIANAYEEDKCPSIKQKDSPTNKCFLKKIDGYDFPTNLISDAFVKNEDLSAEEPNVATIIFDFKIESDTFNNIIDPINRVLRAMGTKLVVIAPSYDNLLCDTILDQYINMEFRSGGINCIFTQFSISRLKDHQLGDFSTIVKSKVITQGLAEILLEQLKSSGPDKVVDDIYNDDSYSLYRLLGYADSVMLTCKNGSLFKVNDIEEDKHYKEVLKSAKNDLKDIIEHTDAERKSYAHKIYEARSRVLQLEMKNYIYYIGADSALQKNIIWDAVEDVIKCLKSAIKYGMVPGCQLTIIQSSEEAIDEIISKYSDKDELINASNEDKLKIELLTIINHAVIDVYSQILHGPEGLGMIKTLDRWQYTTGEDGVKVLHDEAVKKGAEIIRESIKRMEVFDIENLDFNKNIITSAETDQMVLTVASELVKILISGNQCLILDSDIDESHEEKRQVYV